MDIFDFTPEQEAELKDRDDLLHQELDAIADDARTMELECEAFDLEKELQFVNGFLKSIGAGTGTPTPVKG